MQLVFNHYTRFSAIITLLALFTHSVWANTQHVHTMKRVEVASQNAPLQPIMIQGPMPIEAEYFAALLDNTTTEYSGNAVFYKGTLNGYPIVVAKTGKGLENTAAATAIGIERYHPRLIINQGTSGGHVPFLGIRVLSNNITNHGEYDPTTAKNCQAFVEKVVRAYISALSE